MDATRSHAPLVEFVRDPDPFIAKVSGTAEPLFLTEGGSEALVLLPAAVYDRLRMELTGTGDAGTP